MDYYLVKKSITNYCFVKHVGKRLKDNLQKEGIKFETEKYIYQENNQGNKFSRSRTISFYFNTLIK